jgi:hypothetical protein
MSRACARYLFLYGREKGLQHSAPLLEGPEAGLLVSLTIKKASVFASDDCLHSVRHLGNRDVSKLCEVSTKDS